LFKDQSAGVAEIGLVLPQAVLDPSGVGMEVLQSLKASGAHAARCSAVPRLSCAAAVVAQSNTASTSKGVLVFEIMSSLSEPWVTF
jgi:hypothetical protein